MFGYRKWFEVHVPSWHADSHVQDCDTLAEAQYVRDMTATENRDAVVWMEQRITLPFGWSMARSVEVKG